MTKFGVKFSNLIIKIGGFIASKKWLYYLLNYTWGLLPTLLGWLLYLCCMPFAHYRSKRYGRRFIGFDTKSGWGFSLGTSIFISNRISECVIPHEIGHTIQNAIFGPFQIILVDIPSAIRFWYRKILAKCGKKLIKKYDDIWFESSATSLGVIISITWKRNWSTDRRKEKEKK